MFQSIRIYKQLLINDSDLLIKTRERIDESTHKTDLTESMNQVGSTLLSEILKGRVLRMDGFAILTWKLFQHFWEKFIACLSIGYL